MPPPTASLYRSFFTPEERSLLDASSPDDLLSEINLLRILLTRVLSTSRRTELSLSQHAAILSAFSATGLVLARLVAVQARLHARAGGLWAEIEQGEELARQRLGVYYYLTPPAPA